AMETADIAALTTSQVAALSTSAIAALTTAQVVALDTDIASLGTTQLAALTWAHQLSMTTTQIAALSTLQLNALKFSTPLVLDLTDHGVQTQHLAAGIRFDLNATGDKIATGWLSSGNGFLAIDRNHDGEINDGSELFGSGSRLRTGERAIDGFAALRDLDSNHDGVIDAADRQFKELKVWADQSMDGKSQANELHTLADMEIVRIDLNAARVTLKDNGNLLGMLSSYTTRDGKSHLLADVWLATSNNIDNRVIDLSALDTSLVTPHTLGKIDLSGNDDGGDLLVLDINSIWSFGDKADSGNIRMRITGDANNTVRLLEPAALWSNAGVTQVDDADYQVLRHDGVELLVGVKVHVEFAFE
ncbi:MAG: hypothetical protein WC073_11875, partial [Sterolibacterium sp.]